MSDRFKWDDVCPSGKDVERHPFINATRDPCGNSCGNGGAEKVYEGYEPLRAEDVAETILFAVTRPQHVNVAELLVLPTAQASVGHVKKD